MESIKHIYKVGNGPSSSHTMGPKRAAEIFVSDLDHPAKLRITLYGSLAATGKGHMTDVAILEVLEKVASTEMVWEPKVFLPFHPNGMLFEAFNSDGQLIKSYTVYSVGGGSLANEDFDERTSTKVYPHDNLSDIIDFCTENALHFWEYVERYEDENLWPYMEEIWAIMHDAVDRGLDAVGILPGGLNLRRKAGDYLIRAKGYGSNIKSRGLVYAYALAVSEENAAGGRIVTAPTCGSCGVVPAVLYHLYTSRDFPVKRLHRALATAGLFANVVRTNASISGAEVGCQGEIGVACSMAAAAASQLFGGTLNQIEYAAEMGLEHHLGLTCDPVCGLVQIPCIERNAFAAARALDANTYATFSDGLHRVSFDQVVEVMKQTGKDLPSLYKETSEGGLALHHLSIQQLIRRREKNNI